MNIGYACLTVGVPHTDQKSCMMKSVSDEKLAQIIAYNLNSLEHIIDYNIKNNIKLFRISSDLIPFGSSKVNQLPWWDVFSSEFKRIENKIHSSGMRVSMHPGQYTVLNSPKEEVVERAIDDLNYHAKVLDSLHVGPEHKIVLHIGGIYQDKSEAINRFVANYSRLQETVKQRLVIENDDKSYNIYDVLEIGKKQSIPVVFDNLHNKINAYPNGMNEYDWIRECNTTWRKEDGNQKIHYSSQAALKRPGSHSNSIPIDEFIKFYKGLENSKIDIMLEVKDKNLSAVKCINCTTKNEKVLALELEWSKYKYTVLEHSNANYLAIRRLLRDKKSYPATQFYSLIEEALQEEIVLGGSINAAQHVWGYFKECTSDKEKEQFLVSLEKFRQGKTSLRTMKNFLWKLSVKYQQPYLLDSYYFVL